MGVQGPELMDRFLKHAERFETEIIFDQIHTAKLEREADHAGRRRGRPTPATRSSSRPAPRRMYLGLPSEQAFMGKGVSGCATCDGFFYKGQDVVRGRRRQHRGRGSALPLQHREARDRGPSPRQVPRREDPAGQALRQAERGQGRRSSGTTRSTKCWATSPASPACASSPRKTARPRSSTLTGCFIAIGHKPNTDIFAGQLEMKNGYIITKSGLERQRDRDQRAGRVRRGRRAGPRLPPGGHQRRHGLHGRARRRQVPREPGVKKEHGRGELFREAVRDVQPIARRPSVSSR